MNGYLQSVLYTKTADLFSKGHLGWGGEGIVDGNIPGSSPSHFFLSVSIY